MKLLAIDTATELCSVALYLDGEIDERATCEPRAHADNVLPFISELLAAADLSLTQLDGIAFGRGPGGFTGLRVAASVTQGIAFGADLPVASVSDLAALAHGAFSTHGGSEIAAALDARMGELYYAVYRCEDGSATAVFEDSLVLPDTLKLPNRPAPTAAAGPGWRAHWDKLPETVRNRLGDTDDAPPSARAVASLGVIELAAGRGVAPEAAIPVYLRDDVARKKASA
jgi:tRNA threonylcarbamoyladenosine biosynthesis protein TsaB